jgi:hypothetical protein
VRDVPQGGETTGVERPEPRDVAHRCLMEDVTTPPLPGRMTVSPLFGWEDILTVLAVLVVAAVAFLALGAGGAGADERSEWQAWLDARSGRRRDAATDPRDRPAGSVRPSDPRDQADGTREATAA